MTRLVLATQNQHKVAELRDMFARSDRGLIRGLLVSSASEFASERHPAPDVAETEHTFAGNALLKLEGFCGWLREVGLEDDDLVVADDSGLCVDAFGGQPGVWSARFAGETATDADNNTKLVRELEALGLSSSRAEYVCVLAWRRVGAGPSRWVEGRCVGEVRVAAQGTGGFGYDPHFWVDEGARTFAELGERKAERSHRGDAMRRLVDALAAE